MGIESIRITRVAPVDRQHRLGARAAWEDAIRLSPQDHKIYINRARALSVADPAQAIRDYRTALGIVDISYTRYSLAELLANTSDKSVQDPEGAFREAEAALRSARKYKANSVAEKCYELLERTDPARAIEKYEGELRDRDSATLRYRLVNLLANAQDKKLRDPEAAVQQAKLGLRLARKAGLKATESKMRIALACAQYRAGEYADALAGFKSAQDSKSGNPIIVASFRAMTHWQLGEKEEARRWLATANELTNAGTVDPLGFIAARLEEARALVK